MKELLNINEECPVNCKKREAIEQAYIDVTPDTKPQWEGNQGIIEWLKSFNK